MRPKSGATRLSGWRRSSARIHCTEVDMDNRTQIKAGMTVFGSDGDKVGKIIGFEGEYFVVEKGFFFPSDHYIPTTAVASTDADGVYLTVTKDQELGEGWDRQPEGW